MMLEEPYRWAEAVANRREYIEDQLRDGSPVVGLVYREGILFLTLADGQRKLFEVYDRIGMAGLGHPTDIEKLRQAAVELASVIGFNYSEMDVTLQQIVHFGLGPNVKTGFDEIFRSPYIAKILLGELDAVGEGATVYTVDYDGVFHRSEGSGCIAGLHEAGQMMIRQLQAADSSDMALPDAVDTALQAWALGRWVATQEELPAERSELEKVVEGADLSGTLKSDLERLEVEAVVFDRTREGKGKYRQLFREELDVTLNSYRS